MMMNGNFFDQFYKVSCIIVCFILLFDSYLFSRVDMTKTQKNINHKEGSQGGMFLNSYRYKKVSRNMNPHVMQSAFYDIFAEYNNTVLYGKASDVQYLTNETLNNEKKVLFSDMTKKFFQ